MKSNDFSSWVLRLKDPVVITGLAVMLFSGVIRIVLQDTAPRGSLIVKVLGYVFLAGALVATAGFLKKGKKPVEDSPVPDLGGKDEINQGAASGHDSAVVSGGVVNITYNGISGATLGELRKTIASNRKTEERLLKTLVDKNIDISARDAEIRTWIERYNELSSRLEKRADTIAAKAAAMLKGGGLDDAEELLKQSLEKNLQAADEGKKAAAQDAFELAGIRELRLDYRGARDYYEQATRLEPQSSAYLNKLGVSWASLGDLRMAIGYYTRALDIDVAAHGASHRNVATYYNNIGAAWDSLGEPKKAIEYFAKALEIDIAVDGNKNPNAAIRYNNMGLSWNALGDPKKALDCFTKALDIDLAVHGASHPDIAMDYNNVGGAWEALGDSRKAMDCYNKALDIDLAAYGAWHPKAALRYNNIGFTWNALGDSKKAIECFAKALDVDLAVYGARHPDVAVDCNNVGAAWHSLGDLKKAAEYYAKALDIFEKAYGAGNAHAVNLRAKLEKISKEQGL